MTSSMDLAATRHTLLSQPHAVAVDSIRHTKRGDDKVATTEKNISITNTDDSADVTHVDANFMDSQTEPAHTGNPKAPGDDKEVAVND